LTDWITVAGKPAPSGALAGIHLLTALVLFAGLGLAGGWVVGHPAAGAAIGAAIGIPISFYFIYRLYRDI
jgi:hypothetical protein